MSTLIVRSNLDSAAVLIRDLGFVVPGAGGSQTFTDQTNIDAVLMSADVRTLTADGAFPGGTDPDSNTLILNDGSADIPPGNIDAVAGVAPMVGASAVADGQQGLVPQPLTGQQALFLRGDGTWAAAGGASAGTIVRTYTAGVQLRDVVYQKSDGTVDRGDASAGVAGTIPVVGVVSAIDSPAAGQCEITHSGDVGGFSGLVAGKVYILAATPGGIVADDDTGNANYPDDTPGSGDVSQEVGYAKDASTLFVGVLRDYDVF